MTCVDCENFYVKDYINGLCHDCGKVFKRTDCECENFIPRKKNIVPMLDYIASKITLFDLVLFEDGAPMFRLTKDTSVDEIEIILRCMCREYHTYDIIDYKDIK